MAIRKAPAAYKCLGVTLKRCKIGDGKKWMGHFGGAGGTVALYYSELSGGW